ncbi:hypothetical protein AB4225_36125 [Streptomyces sp. 2RAF24]|uniref:hypothetical protein n=1 Tax=unclassified Streptomyces TaxID=2593676 RepID=UPI0033F6DE90
MDRTEGTTAVTETVRRRKYAHPADPVLEEVVRLLVSAAVSDGGKRVGVYLADQNHRILIAALSHTDAQAEDIGRKVGRGLMLDRVAADGSLAPWRPGPGLERAFPLGGHLTTGSSRATRARSSSPTPR